MINKLEELQLAIRDEVDAWSKKPFVFQNEFYIFQGLNRLFEALCLQNWWQKFIIMQILQVQQALNLHYLAMLRIALVASCCRLHFKVKWVWLTLPCPLSVT